MVICITGGTGSFGSALARHLLAETSHKIRILDRSDMKLGRMMADYPPSDRLTYILADVRDQQRLITAFYRCDVIVHAAALKQVDFGERHPEEYVKTNVMGTVNAIEAAIVNHVSKFLFISSDKACAPANAYGKGKAVAETLITASNQRSHGLRLASVRGGNVWNSRGSVVELWLKSDTIIINDPNVTRFHLPMDYWLRFCMQAVDEMHGGEIFIPKCDAWQLETLSEAFLSVFPEKRYANVGQRYADRTHEFLISDYESSNAKDVDWGYVIEPSDELRKVWNYKPHSGIKAAQVVSSNAARRMSMMELEELVRQLR